MNDEEKLKLALEELRSWFEAQRKSISKGNASSWDMGQCRDKMDFIDEALSAPTQEQPEYRDFVINDFEYRITFLPDDDAEVVMIRPIICNAAPQAAQPAPDVTDTDILDWILDNYSSRGNGKGFEIRVYVPVDSECVRGAIIETILKDRTK